MQPYLFEDGDVLIEVGKHVGSDEKHHAPKALAILFGYTLPWLGVSDEQFDILRLGDSHDCYAYTCQQVLQNAHFVIAEDTYFLTVSENGDISVIKK